MSDVSNPQQPLSLQQLIDLRGRVLSGEEITREELRHAIESLRQDRVTAATTSASKSKKSAPVAIDLNSLFANLGGNTTEANK